jgi:hypothetical protein
VESSLFFAVPHFLTANRIHFAEKCSRASDPKVEGTFGIDSDAQSFMRRIVECGKPDPLFRTMR